MKVLFAVHDEKVSLSIVKKYQKEYKEIISYKNVYYFNAILKELQRDKTYDRVVIDEELEEFTSTSYEEKDKFIFNKLDSITDEASNSSGKDIPIIIICTERRAKSDEMLVKLFGIGIYNAIIGNDRSTDEVCRLIYSPRSKKDAKTYYKINAKNVDYDPEHENDVSEEEMQHILSYFKRLGKNKEKYVDGFRRIVSQYNEEQMRIIIAILPQNVKEILEEASPEYQKFGIKTGRKNASKTPRVKVDEKPTSEKLLNANQNNNRNPIVVPSTMDKSIIKKVTIKKPSAIRNIEPIEEEEEDTENTTVNEIDSFIKPAKRRGRPPKKGPQEEKISEEPKKKRRGRPPKNKVTEEAPEEIEQFSDLLTNREETEEEESKITPIDESLLRPEPISEDTLPGLDDEDYDEYDDEDDDYDYTSFKGLYGDDDKEPEKTDNYSSKDSSYYEDDDLDVLPKTDDNDESLDILPETDDNDESLDILPGIDDNDNINENGEEEEEYEDDSLFPKDDSILPGMFDEDDEKEGENEEVEKQDYDRFNNYENTIGSSKNVNSSNWNATTHRQIQKYETSYNDFDYTNYNGLLSSERKVIAFVGTSKNGTSFIVNNIAQVLSESGINTAILDVTQNKNSYYIYNNNDDSLRSAAASSIKRLIDGENGGMKVSKNLSVYVEVPGQDDSDIYNAGPILENLAKNHSAILIDCDFESPIEYFANAQEIYLVQSMDVLTIQPLTAFLKELKNRDVLDQNKIRIIVNKSMRLRAITPKQVVGGMSRYNNPEMSMMTELFDRNQIVPIEIPFDVDVYAKYVEGLAECNISVNKYPKEFQNILKKLSAVIYPLLPAKKSKEKPQKGYQYSNGFSNSVNNTLNNMKKKY